MKLHAKVINFLTRTSLKEKNTFSELKKKTKKTKTKINDGKAFWKIALL